MFGPYEIGDQVRIIGRHLLSGKSGVIRRISKPFKINNILYTVEMKDFGGFKCQFLEKSLEKFTAPCAIDQDNPKEEKQQ